MLKRVFSHFSEPMNLVALNGGLIAILVGLNTYFQAFCIPTPWAVIVLSICFVNTVLYPVLEKTKLAPLTSFINGLSLLVFIYCMLFLEHMNLLGLVMIPIGVGLVIFIPHFFVIQLIYRNTYGPKDRRSRYYFSLAVVLGLGMVFYIGQDYQAAIKSIDRFKETNFQVLDKRFMTEKILGMHFIYHTRYCELDGWRPPKHEPILVLGMWLNKRVDPLKVDLKTRLALYQKFFPEHPYKFDCSCGIQYRQDYHQDDLWR